MKLVVAAIVTFATCLVLASCGGSSGSAPNPIPATSAPTGLSYPTPQALTINKSVTPVNPTVTNSPTSYSVSPALPAGLTLNTTTGVITGTPTAVTARATYTVTATNSGGSATTALVLTVNDAVPTVGYSSGRVALAVGLPTATLTPSSTGGTVTSWSITPALPAGLTLGTADGTITGTPTATSAAQVYTVTAINSGGNSTFALNLSVETGTVLELGHDARVDLIRFDGTHVLSLDFNGHWVLWDYATASNVANGTTGCFETNTCYSDPKADMAGSVFVAQTPTHFELHSTTDGHLLGTVPITIGGGDSQFFWWRLASDGSYFVAGGFQGLKVWSPAGGPPLFTIPGNYTSAVAFAAPGQVRLTAGPNSAHAIETIDIATGTSTVSANYNGTFLRWFEDGSRFLSSAAGTVLTYSKDLVQQDATVLASAGIIGGSGNFFWNNHSTALDIYQVGASGAPKASFTSIETGPVASGSTLGLFVNGQLSVVDLSVATPVKTDHTLPAAGAGPSEYAATDAAHWMIGNDGGIVVDGAPVTPRLFNYGKALSVAGSSSRFAVSVASGQILYFDSTSLAQQDTIPKAATKMQFSADGTVLAALTDTLNIYSLPSKTVLKTWSNTSDFTLSDSGTVLGQVFAGGGIVHEVSSVDGSTVIWTDQLSVGPITLAPGGNPIAISQGNAPPFHGSQIPATQSINNGALVTAFAGFPVGWLDGQHLLLDNYQEMNQQGAVFVGASIVSPTGTKLADAPLPELARFQLLGADSIYAPELNEIVSPTTGAVSWNSGDSASAKMGAVAGSHVVFVSGARVLVLSQ